jgi:hypothetical protein
MHIRKSTTTFVIPIALALALAAPLAAASERATGEIRERATERVRAEARKVGEAANAGKAGCPSGWTDMNAGGAGGPACVTEAVAKALKPSSEVEACPRPFVRKCAQVKPNWTICWCETQVPQE